MMLMLLIGGDQLLFTKVASEFTCTVIYQLGHVDRYAFLVSHWKQGVYLH